MVRHGPSVLALSTDLFVVMHNRPDPGASGRTSISLGASFPSAPLRLES